MIVSLLKMEYLLIDVNNILKEELEIISAGTVDYTGGDINKTSVKKHMSVKPEANSSAMLWVGSSYENM